LFVKHFIYHSAKYVVLEKTPIILAAWGVACLLKDIGPFWSGSPISPAKILVAHQVLVIVMFVAKILAANVCPPLPLTDSCQIVGQIWAKDGSKNWLPTLAKYLVGLKWAPT
jgi:hypothetical protein